MDSVMKYRIEFEYAPYPLDKLWLDVRLTERWAIDESGDRFEMALFTAPRTTKITNFLCMKVLRVLPD